jgi:hypothetical protein
LSQKILAYLSAIQVSKSYMMYKHGCTFNSRQYPDICQDGEIPREISGHSASWRRFEPDNPRIEARSLAACVSFLITLHLNHNTVTCRGGCLIYRTSFGLDDWIYWHYIHKTRNHRQLQRYRWSAHFTVRYTLTRNISLH